MNRVTKALGVSALALIVSIGASGCNAASSARSSTGNASSSAVSAAPANTAEAWAHTPSGVASSLNLFFASVKKETVQVMMPSGAGNTSEVNTAEQRLAYIDATYPESMAYVDSTSLAPESKIKMMRSLAMLSFMSGSAIAQESGITLDGDKATVPAESLEIIADGVVQSTKTGTLTLKYAGDKWKIVGYTAASK